VESGLKRERDGEKCIVEIFCRFRDGVGVMMRLVGKASACLKLIRQEDFAMLTLTETDESFKKCQQLSH